MSASAIDSRGLRKAFGDVVACSGIDLRVDAAEIVGLVGPDGAGKTTTMRMLCGILMPDGGQATVAGHDVVSQPEGVKRRIGYLPQRFSLHRDLTIDENIRYFADLYDLPGGWEGRRDELLEITYLTPFRGRLAGRLSGGMRQKLSLVCTLIHQPEVVFLDEPTTGVDPVSRRDFWKILYDLPRQGVTMLISTPYMDEASRCHRVAFMHEGAVLAVDTPAALRRSLQGRVLQVRCRPQRQARETLKALPQVEGVEVFGDRLHVVLRAGAGAPGGERATPQPAATPQAQPAGGAGESPGEEAIRRALSAAGVQCQGLEPREPSLEDVFMAMTTHHRALSHSDSPGTAQGG